MDRSIIRKTVVTGVVLLIILFITECGLKASKQPDSTAQHHSEAKKPIMFDYEKKTVMLNSGYEMPIIGLGTWTLSDEEAEESVYQALKVGMRLIDTARYYRNEVGVGRGLQRAIDEGIVTREDVFITSKIYGGDYKSAKGIIADALKDLNIDYIDLLLIHQPGADDKSD